MTASPLSELENLTAIRKNIQQVCKKIGRNPEEISVMAVTKTVPPERVNTVLANGVSLIGENRVQEYLSKKELYQKPYEFHFIGHLQTNKVKDIIRSVDCIESVDSLHLLECINKEAEKANRCVPCLLEWNVGEETSKTGANEEEIRRMLVASMQMKFVKMVGLMSIPPASADAEAVRPYFVAARRLFEELQQTPEGQNFSVLSMGMSHDYTIAVEEGATLVRIGSALFGNRVYQSFSQEE